jgi:HTH-type transcriptional regulator, glycine betaine synthesis regulator
MALVLEKRAVGNQKAHGPDPGITPLETEIIALFVQVSRVLGQPRSIAEIYGLLFISADPLSMEDLIERLQLSKGSASQGLRFLRNMGAIRTVYVAGDRRAHFEAVAELRNLVTRFLHDQLTPHFESGQARLERIAGMVKQLPPDQRARLNARITMLRSWGRNGKRFLPLVTKLLGG